MSFIGIFPDSDDARVKYFAADLRKHNDGRFGVFKRHF